jgi:chemotaxis protein MotB
MGKKHAHHGGAWKVAYADFVTAMMALFLVLWLTSQDEKIKKAIERSFRQPFATSTSQVSSSIIPSTAPPKPKPDSSGNFDSASAFELSLLRKLTEDLQQTLDVKDEDKSVELELTPDGLKISIFDRSQKPVFKPGSKDFTPYGKWVFSTLAWQIARYKSFAVELEGHTESQDNSVHNNYDSWELSASRANTARAELLDVGVSKAQIRKISGYGDTQPMPGRQPDDESNRRVTVMLRINDKAKSGG